MINQEYIEIKEHMDKTMHVLHEKLAAIRAGRANPAVLDKIMIEYYGVPTPLKQVAGVSVPEARQIVIQPWDLTLLTLIEKEIQKSDLGINPNNDGKIIRLNFPTLTEERRKDLVKKVRKLGEESKIAIRAIRRDSIEKLKRLEKSSDITEDDLRDSEKEIQKITDNHGKLIDEVVQDKEAEILEV